MAPPPTVSLADLHLHTTHSDGTASVEALLNYVVGQTDLRVIAVTDHDTLDGGLEARERARRRGLPIEVVVGAEISSGEGHILGLWLSAPVPAGLSAAETVARIHAQGGLAIAAHPFFRARQPSRPMAPTMQGVGHLLASVSFDAIEAVNGTPGLQLANRRARRFNRDHRHLPEIGASDAHILAAIGKAHTLFAGQTADDLRRSLTAGTVVPAATWYRPGDLVAYASFWVRLSRAHGAPAW